MGGGVVLSRARALVPPPHTTHSTHNVPTTSSSESLSHMSMVCGGLRWGQGVNLPAHGNDRLAEKIRTRARASQEGSKLSVPVSGVGRAGEGGAGGGDSGGCRQQKKDGQSANEPKTKPQTFSSQPPNPPRPAACDHHGDPRRHHRPRRDAGLGPRAAGGGEADRVCANDGVCVLDVLCVCVALCRRGVGVARGRRGSGG